MCGSDFVITGRLSTMRDHVRWWCTVTEPTMTRPAATACDLPRRPLRSPAVDACFDLLAAYAPNGPDAQLMLALILDAVIQLQRRDTMAAVAAASWIRDGDGAPDAPVSFRAACAALGIDAEYLARGLLRTAARADDRERTLELARWPHTTSVSAAAAHRSGRAPSPNRSPRMQLRPAGRVVPLASRTRVPPSTVLAAALSRTPWWVPLAVGASASFTVIAASWLLVS